MPLHDHFRPPVSHKLPWSTLHTGWAANIAESLNDILPEGFVALEQSRPAGRIEVDIGTYEEWSNEQAWSGNGTAATATLTRPRTYSPPTPARTCTPVIPAETKVLVYQGTDQFKLIAAIDLVSPANKDRPEARQAFVAKCASYICSGVSLIVLDAVTDRHANLHREYMRLLEQEKADDLPADCHLYAVSYRPLLRDDEPELQIWPVPLVLGAPLPVMPLRLIADEFVPVDFEATYTETCRKRRLV